MSGEPFYCDDENAENPEKEYRDFIDKWLTLKSHPVSNSPFMKGLKSKREFISSEAERKKFDKRNEKYSQSVNDAVDNFISICERAGLDRKSLTTTRIESACLFRDSRFLPDPLLELIVKNKTIKEALGELSLIVHVNRQIIMEGRKGTLGLGDVRRQSERVRRFYRTGVANYLEKLQELESNIESMKDMSIADLQELDGDFQSIAQAVASIAERIAKEIRSRDAKAGASEKLAKDPKQVDKAAVRECWDLWQKDLSRYKGKAEFARDMMAKYENLKSAEVIARWCREWESTTQPAK